MKIINNVFRKTAVKTGLFTSFTGLWRIRTGFDWKTTLQKDENHEEWRKLVVKSTVVPRRSARPGDR